MTTIQLPDGRIGYRISEACRLIGLSRNTLYTYLRKGRLRAKKFGHATVIPDAELRRFLDEAEDYTPDTRA